MSRKYIQNCTGDGEINKNSTKKRHFSKYVFYFLLFSFLTVTIYIFFFSPYLEISSVQISGNEELSGVELEQLFNSAIDGKYLNILPRNNYLFISSDSIENFYKQRFKKIRNIHVQKKFPNFVQIQIEERKALLVWCTNSSCYLIDENGAAYSQADFNAPELSQNHLLRINDKSNEQISVGDAIISNDFEQYLLNLKPELTKLGFEVGDEFWTSSRMAQEIDTKTANGTELYFSTQFSLADATRSLATILKKEISQDQKNELAYLDLRTQNKIFYKLNNSQPQEPHDGEQNSEEKK